MPRKTPATVAASPCLVELERVSKSFGPVHAVQDLTLQLPADAIVALLGVNGAGKSTTMGLLAGTLVPDRGRIRIAGHDLARDPIAARLNIGYLPENPGRFPDLQVLDYLRFMAAACGVAPAALQKQIKATGCQQLLARPFDALSRGQRQRVLLAAALLHDPKVLLLDEPTAGLDPLQRKQALALFKKLAAGRCLLLATHHLDEVLAICTHVAVLQEGRLRHVGTLDAFCKAEQAGAVTKLTALLTEGAGA